MIKKPKSSLRRKEKKAVDQMMSAFAFISPLSATPQIVTIFGKQEASGVSIVSWSLYLLIGLITLAYGYFHKLRPIIISQLLWTIVDVLIIVGILMYGSGKTFRANYDTLLVFNGFGKALVILSFCFGTACLYFSYMSRTNNTIKNR